MKGSGEALLSVYKINLTNREAWARKSGKHVWTSGNSGYFQDGGALIHRLPAFKTVVAFVVVTLLKLPDPWASIFSIVQTSQPLCKHVLALVKLPDPRIKIYVLSLLKFPAWGVHECSKSPPYPVVPPSGITLIAAFLLPKLDNSQLSNEKNIASF